MEENKAKIKALLSRFFPGHTLQEDENFFALGFVNSLFAIQLVLLVENNFNIKLEADDFDFENFKTINAIAQLVERKTASVKVAGARF